VSWNGSGAFSRVFGATGWTNDKNASVNILSSRHDTHDQDLADGINLCITKDGQNKPAATITPNSNNAYDWGSIALIWRYIYSSAYRLVNSGFYSSLIPATLTANRTITIPDATGNMVVSGVGYYFHASRNGGIQTLVLSATTTLTFDVSYDDPSSQFANGTGIFTAAVSGFYNFSTVLRLQNNTVGAGIINYIYFSKNNSTTFFVGTTCMLIGLTEGGSIGASSNIFDIGGSWGVRLAAGDTVRIKANIGAGANITHCAESLFSGSLVVS
jgi:hypothetical protein